MQYQQQNYQIPAILAPAGNKDAFLAALAAGADAIYCGMKAFSARMEAKNFGLEELVGLTELAHAQGCEVRVAFNTLLKADELTAAGRLLEQLTRDVKPDAVIVQDLGMLPLIRETGFRGQVHLSTLTGGVDGAALGLIHKDLGADQVVLPRELNIDEIKGLAAACPPGLGLEVFIHGALCYGVSGRCYWSSYLGGRSSLRGQCVQPCRRRYRHGDASERFFSNQDLSLDVLIKVLKEIPAVRTWKIEGRKKGPHYVYYTVNAYRMLRDEGSDPQIKKAALALLERSLGRRGTHFHFLPQRPQNPIDPNQPTGSGMLIGRLKGAANAPFFTPKEPLLRGDRLRIGYEDQPGHTIIKVGRAVPAGGRFVVKPSSKTPFFKGTPVFLTDRREQALTDMIAGYEERLTRVKVASIRPGSMQLKVKSRRPPAGKPVEITVRRRLSSDSSTGNSSFWLQPDQEKHIDALRYLARIWCWLPPVIWPTEEASMGEAVQWLLAAGARQFVLNAPWQTALFEHPRKLTLWAGPFCNLTNALALETVAALGFKGAVLSPEIGEADYLQLPRQSPIPLGVIIKGHWPLTIARYVAEQMRTGVPFTSTKGEQAWVAQYGQNYWVYPNWPIDLTAHKAALAKAGFRMFVELQEPVPKSVTMKPRPGLWNWKGQLI